MMSPEKYQESEPVLSPESHESAVEIADKLRDLYQNTTLKGGKLEIPAFRNESQMGISTEPDEGSRQQLQAVIKAGQEFFGIVRAEVSIRIPGESVPEIIESTILTRHNKNARASVIAVIERGHGTEYVGRAHQNGLGDQVSRHHLYLEQDLDGSITVVDGNADGTPSTNGTEVFEIDSDRSSEKSAVESPLTDNDFWSADPLEIQDRINKSLY